MSRVVPLSVPALLSLVVVLTAACTSPRQDVPPPPPGAMCAEPPTEQSRAVEGRLSSSLEAQAATADELLDPKRITVVTCGTGGPLPSDRAQACTAVFVNGRFFVFDAGDGAQRSMERLGLPVTKISAVFVTHFHSDHIGDVGEVISRSWLLGRNGELTVYGGGGVEQVVEAFNDVYALDERYRNAHHGDDILQLGVVAAKVRRIEDPGVDGAVVYDEDGVVVRAYRVDHSPVEPAFGYRVEFKGRVVGISGDTIAAPGLRALAAGADVLVGEVMDKHFVLDMSCALGRVRAARNATIFRDIMDYHIDSLELAQLSEEAGVRTLMLTHMIPTLPPAQARVYFTGPMQKRFSGELIVSEDGSSVTLEL